MKKLILIFSVLIATASSAQVTLTGTSSQSLPAFFIIDKEPKSVAPVTDPNKLTATLLNVFDQQGGLKPDVAIEFAPYWLRDSSKMQLSNLTNRSLCFKSLAFSIASSNDNISENARKLGLGFRFQPFNQLNTTFIHNLQEVLKPNQILYNLLKGIGVTDKAFIVLISDTAAFTSHVNAVINNFPGIDAVDKANTQAALREVLRKVPRFEKETNEAYIKRLIGFILSPVKTYDVSDFYKQNYKFEIAGAAGMRFPTNEIGFSYISRVGVWANYSYNFQNKEKTRQVASLNAMARILSSFTDSVTTNYDLGASFTAKWWKSLPVSLEFVGRHYTYEYDDINLAGDTISRIDRKNTYRFALTADFAIDKDLSLNFTFGRDYDKPFQTSGNLLGIFGLNYTFGTRNKLTY